MDSSLTSLDFWTGPSLGCLFPSYCHQLSSEMQASPVQSKAIWQRKQHRFITLWRTIVFKNKKAVTVTLDVKCIHAYGSTTNLLQFLASHLVKKHSYLSLPDFLLLLFQESRGDASNVVLGTEQQGPQILHELARILSIQEACQVDLHHLTIGVLQHTHEWGGERTIQPSMVIMTVREVRKLYALLNYP